VLNVKLFKIAALFAALLSPAIALAQTDITTEPLVREFANGSTATQANKFAQISGGTAILAPTTWAAGSLYGVVLPSFGPFGPGSSGTSQVTIVGQVAVAMDGTPSAAGDLVTLSTSSGGEGHDASTTCPTSGSPAYGTVHSTTAVSSGIYLVDLGNPCNAPSSGGGSGTVSNCSTADALSYYAATGTTVGCLSGVGTTGQELVSQGSGVAPIWQSPFPQSISWAPGQNLSSAPISIFVAAQARTITAVTCRVDTAVGGTAALNIYVAASGTALGSGTLVTTTACNANGTANTSQTGLASGSVSVPTGSAVGIIASGSGWSSSSGSGAISVYAQ
jgi:hypothetical protein